MDFVGALGLSFGLAEMPGYRIEMEGAMCCVYPLYPPTKNGLETPVGFFGVFDGHGGAACADYLRDNLHNYVVQNENFPQYPQEAIVGGFKECERSFINLVEVAQTRAQNAMPGQQVGPERSGSSATVVMIIDDMAYVINVGDSRCLMSIDAGA